MDRRILEGIGLAALTAALVSIGDYLSTCTVGWCHLYAPVAAAVVSSLVAWLRQSPLSK